MFKLHHKTIFYEKDTTCAKPNGYYTCWLR